MEQLRVPNLQTNVMPAVEIASRGKFLIYLPFVFRDNQVIWRENAMSFTDTNNVRGCSSSQGLPSELERRDIKRKHSVQKHTKMISSCISWKMKWDKRCWTQTSRRPARLVFLIFKSFKFNILSHSPFFHYPRSSPLSPFLQVYEGNCHSVSLIKMRSNCSWSRANVHRPIISPSDSGATQERVEWGGKGGAARGQQFNASDSWCARVWAPVLTPEDDPVEKPGCDICRPVKPLWGEKTQGQVLHFQRKRPLLLSAFHTEDPTPSLCLCFSRHGLHVRV